MAFAKCPKCEKSLLGVNIEEVDGYVRGTSTLRCVAYSCRACGTVLSVEVDPIALKTDIINSLKGR